MEDILFVGPVAHTELKKISQKNIATSRMYDASAVINAYADELEKSGWPI